jgi:hypothetical protein
VYPCTTRIAVITPCDHSIFLPTLDDDAVWGFVSTVKGIVRPVGKIRLSFPTTCPSTQSDSGALQSTACSSNNLYKVLHGPFQVTFDIELAD